MAGRDDGWREMRKRPGLWKSWERERELAMEDSDSRESFNAKQETHDRI